MQCITIKRMNHAFPKRSYAGLIFDCDGTLTDSMPVHHFAWVRTLARYGIEFSEERFYALGGMPSNKIVALLAAESGIEVDAHAIGHEKEDEFLKLLSRLEPIHAVVEVAKTFASRIPISVASGGFRNIILQQLNQIACDELFSVIVTAEDTQRHKPEPDVFLLAAERMNVPPRDCLVYEDSDLGIQAAVAAGMEFVDIRAFHSPKRFEL
jgi:beta-phosphoglucomutase-like phosphatase (HAD superfamily)